MTWSPLDSTSTMSFRRCWAPTRPPHLMSHLQPVPAAELLTRAEFESFRTEMREFKTEVLEAISDVNKRIDRVLLTVVAGQFVLLAGIIGIAIL